MGRRFVEAGSGQCKEELSNLSTGVDWLINGILGPMDMVRRSQVFPGIIIYMRSPDPLNRITWPLLKGGIGML